MAFGLRAVGIPSVGCSLLSNNRGKFQAIFSMLTSSDKSRSILDLHTQGDTLGPEIGGVVLAGWRCRTSGGGTTGDLVGIHIGINQPAGTDHIGPVHGVVSNHHLHIRIEVVANHQTQFRGEGSLAEVVSAYVGLLCQQATRSRDAGAVGSEVDGVANNIGMHLVLPDGQFQGGVK